MGWAAADAAEARDVVLGLISPEAVVGTALACSFAAAEDQRMTLEDG